MLSAIERMWLDIGAMMRAPDLGALLNGALLVAVALAGAWLAARYLGKPLERAATRAAPNLIGHFAGRICPIVLRASAALLLWAFAAARLATDEGRLLLAIALGTAVAMLVYQIARGLRLGAGVAGVIAILLFGATTAGALGGMAPLVAGLDSAAMTIGKRRISLLDIVNALIVIVALFAIVRLLNRLLTRYVASATALDLSQRVLFQKLGGIAVVTVAFFIGIDLIGIDLTALAVFSGAFGLAVGFGMQKTLGNLIAGLILLMDRSIKPGDVIAVSDTFGWVNKIGVRYVSLLTRDGKEHLIPNEKLMTEPVENWSYTNKNVRLHVKVAIPHDCDIHQARALMLKATADHPRILADPEPVAWVTAFSLSAIEHEVRIWIDDPEAGVTNVQSDVLTRIWELFREHGIALPREQQDVRFRPSAT